MNLRYLDFDYSEDSEGLGLFEAMASTGPGQVAALRAEVAEVLDWAWANFPHSRGPVEEGGEWDYELQAQQEFSAVEQLDYDPVARVFGSRLEAPGLPRHALTLTISGVPGFCKAFSRRFVPE